MLIEEGIENTNKLTKKEISLLSKDEINSSKRLACQTIVNGPVSVSWKEKIR